MQLLTYTIMVKAKTWILKKHFEGFPKESNFELREEVLPELQDGGMDNSDFVFLYTCAMLH